MGVLGNILLGISFLSALVGAILGVKRVGTLTPKKWLFQKVLFAVHGVTLLGSIFVLYGLMFSKDYSYAYVARHVHNDLPTSYLFSSFWEGQEGSFMLWAFFGVVGLYFVFRSRVTAVRASAGVLLLLQAVLLSMVVGWSLPGSEATIGVSPFLKGATVPADGLGLNPLLQNPWMVIHPPVIFLSFALAAIPFALVIANRRSQSIPVDLLQKTTLLGTAVLTIGITMGAYWAYETLNFGGYWSWDPVENAIYVPWLMYIASLHLWYLAAKKKTLLKTASGFSLATFLLVLYSTFLTRSGVLGDSSVHAFTENGLSFQLILLVVIFLVVAILPRRRIQKSNEQKAFSFQLTAGNTWILIGVTTLALASFQVLLPTSAPVFNKIAQALGSLGNMAPPSDAVVFYSNAQLYFGILLTLGASVAQWLYWQKKGVAHGKLVLVSTLISTGLITWLLSSHLANVSFSQWVLLAGALLGILTLFFLIFDRFSLIKEKAGPILSHLGFFILLIGILVSGTQQIIESENAALGKNGEPSENLLLVKGEVTKLNGAMYSYEDDLLYLPDRKQFISREQLNPTSQEGWFVVASSEADGFEQGDTLKATRATTYYKIKREKEDGSVTYLYPKVQFSSAMGAIFNPFLTHSVSSDLYVHITNLPDTKALDPSKAPSTILQLQPGKTHFENNRGIQLKKITRVVSYPGVPMDPSSDLALKATLELVDPEGIHYAETLLIMSKDGVIRTIPSRPTKSGISFEFKGRNSESGGFEVNMTSLPKKWITIRMVRFPFISLVWIGVIFMSMGMTFSLFKKLFSARTSNAGGGSNELSTLQIDPKGQLIGDIETTLHRKHN